MYFFRLCIGRNRRVRLLVDEVEKHLLHLALPVSADFEHLGIDHTVRSFLNIGTNLIFHHRIQFVRRSRKKNRGLTVFLQGKSRSCAVCVGKYHRALRHQRLTPVAIRNIGALALPVPVLQMCPHLRILD